MLELEASALGKRSPYVDRYTSSLLFPIPRQTKRDELAITSQLPFHGWDQWNAFELSWLNQKGKPVAAIMEAKIPATSPNLIESKSFKLYLNSFNNESIADFNTLKNILTRDLSAAVGAEIDIKLYPLSVYNVDLRQNPDGNCLDELDVVCDVYTPSSLLLTVLAGTKVSERHYSNLLKSNCLVTGQPDWGTLIVDYQGEQIVPESLLRYIVSFRNHNEFHEQCVERIFMDILTRCRPSKLTVEARYTRRGGLDINPCRSTESDVPYQRYRLVRQ